MYYIFIYIFCAVGIYLSVYVIYTLFLILTNYFVREKKCLHYEPKTYFAVIIPAHNEQLLLEKLLISIKKQNYPDTKIELLVVADNCSDETAAIGKKNGAVVLERCEPTRCGKGYAIKYALENIDVNVYDAVFIADADSVLDENTLFALDCEIQRGARVIQCYNGLANPDESWFTRIMDVSRTLGNEVLEPGREKIGFSSHLMGNGMCFVLDVISKYGWDAFTVGEDWEYYAKLVIRDERIVFAKNARILHMESVNIYQATSQRLRWSSGRFAIAAKYGFRLLYDGIKNCKFMKIDASLPLLLPNPSLGMSMTILMFTLCFIIPLTVYRWYLVWWYFMLAILQIAFFLIGIFYVKNKMMKLLAMLFAPIFMIWKSILDLLSVVGIGRRYWVRTERKL